MKKIFGLIFGLLLLALTAGDVVAQTDVENVPLPKSLMVRDNSPLAERKVKFVVGGNVGFGVSYSQLNMQVSPHFGICPGIDFICVLSGECTAEDVAREAIAPTVLVEHLGLALP